MIFNTIIVLKYLLFIVLYWISFYIFGGYIRMVEFTELCTNFLCKELDKLEPAYDYIVVGCGSAGSVVALRLAEDKHATVLVLEAGPYGGRWFDIPAVGPILQLSPIDWHYRTEPQVNAAKAFHEQVSSWPMGRVVGGTGRLNYMVYIRGHWTDYSEWFRNVPNYNYEKDILTYFKKSENHRGSYINDTKYHSQDGPLIVEDLTFETPLASAFLEAVALLGYPVNDLNRKYNTGFMKSQVNTNFGDRWTPAHNFFTNKKENIIIRTNAFVQRVLLRDGFEAYGVEYVYLGEKLTVYARKGVILSAGVIGTPKLLMLSGIGPKDHLSNIGIKTKVNLPVGNNLQDHVSTGSDLVLLNTSIGVNIETILTPSAGFNYLFYSTGPWTVTGAEVVGVINTGNVSYSNEDCDNLDSFLKVMNHFNNVAPKNKKELINMTNKSLPKAQRYRTSRTASGTHHSDNNSNSKSNTAVDDSRQAYKPTKFVTNKKYACDKSRPDLGFMVIPGGASTDHGGHTKKASGLSDEAWNNYFVPLRNENPITILPIALHPKSRGTVRLVDKKPKSYPRINPNYLSNHNDIKTLLKGIDLIKKIIKTEPMQKLGARLNNRKFPGCESYEFDTEAYWKCYVRHLTITTFHPVGTCKMGHPKDEETVVGFDFRVHNTNKLYVVDASVMPSLISGNPNAAVIMMGEKAADEIKFNQFLNQKKCMKREILIPTSVCRT